MYLREQYRHIIAFNAKSDDIFEDVFKYPSLRKGYAQNENILSVPTFFIIYKAHLMTMKKIA